MITYPTRPAPFGGLPALVRATGCRTQAELARLVGWTPNHLSRFKTGTRRTRHDYQWLSVRLHLDVGRLEAILLGEEVPVGMVLPPPRGRRAAGGRQAGGAV